MLLDERGDLRARFPWRPRQAAGEEHVELGLEAPDLGLEVLHLADRIRIFGVAMVDQSKQVKPEQRQPQLPRVRDGPIVDQHFDAGHRPDQLEQIAASAARRSRKTARDGGGLAPSPVSRNSWPRPAPSRRPGRSSRPSNGGNTSVIENGSSRGPNSVACRSGIERGQLLRRRLLRLLDVGPESLDGAIFAFGGQGTRSSSENGSRVPGCQRAKGTMISARARFQDHSQHRDPAAARRRPRAGSATRRATRRSRALRDGADAGARARSAAGDGRRREAAADVIEALARSRAGRPGARIAAARDQRHRRRDPHQPGTRAARRGGHRAGRRDRARLQRTSNTTSPSGERGSRTVHAESLLTSITGAEAAHRRQQQRRRDHADPGGPRERAARW